MRKNTAVAVTLCALLAAGSIAGAGGTRGGRSGGSQGSDRSTRQERGTIQSRGSAPAAGQQRSEIRATARQADQYRNVVRATRQGREQVRSLIQTGATAGGAEQGVPSRDRLRESVRAMDQEHRRLVDGLEAGQQLALQEQLRRMERSMAEVYARYRALDGVLADPAADGNQVTRQARKVERAMKSWERRVRKLGSEWGVES